MHQYPLQVVAKSRRLPDHVAHFAWVDFINGRITYEEWQARVSRLPTNK